MSTKQAEECYKLVNNAYIFNTRMCNVQNMKQQKRVNTGSMVLTIEIIIIIIIIETRLMCNLYLVFLFMLFGSLFSVFRYVVGKILYRQYW